MHAFSTYTITEKDHSLLFQIIVNDVHIRYEDGQADPSQPFTMGVTLENVSAQSTDENWVGLLGVCLSLCTKEILDMALWSYPLRTRSISKRHQACYNHTSLGI